MSAVWETDTRVAQSSSGAFAGVSALRRFASLDDLIGNQAPDAGLKTEWITSVFLPR
jgi:hypothetical protein